MLPKCFCCHKNIECARTDGTEEDHWNIPCGVSFKDTGNFGSTIYDSCYDGVHVEIVICDDCLVERKDLLREIPTPGYVEARQANSLKVMDELLKEDPHFFDILEDGYDPEWDNHIKEG